MCGINGIYRWDSKPIDSGLVKSMAACQVHRGPDEEGFYFSNRPSGPQAGLGFRRLAIIDLSGGKQPMSSADGKVHLIFNGEIYNFLELKSDLEKQGRKFATRSDTEVILQLYEVHGKECVKFLRGMFAFAIYDERSGEIFIARDRIGKKPVFYAKAGGALYFASEMKSILQAPEVRRQIRPESIPLYLTYQFIPSPHTIFENIFRLPPAHFMACKPDGHIEVEKYWTLTRTPPTRQSVDEICEELRAQLREATRIRLISDVPLGAFLSGGVDSSAVVGFMAEELKEPVKTFSIGFEESDFSELHFAKLVAERFKTDHHEFIVKPDMTGILPKLAWYYDQPFADPSALPSYYVAHETRKHVTVALNGDGGDENFGGYLRYQADLIFHQISKIPKFVRSPLAALLRTMPLSMQKGFLLRSLARAGSVLDATPAEFNFGLFRYFDQESQEKLYESALLEVIHKTPAQSYLDSLYSTSDSSEWMDQVLSADAHGYLPDCLLVKMDIASMANSLEARSPLLDHKLMEYVAKIPWRYKVRTNGGKWILKRALKGFVPDEILERRKMGFGIPIAHWFRGPLKDFLRDHLLSQKAKARGYFKPSEVERLVNEHQSAKKNHGYKLWALLMLELWHQQYIDVPQTALTKSS